MGPNILQHSRLTDNSISPLHPHPSNFPSLPQDLNTFAMRVKEWYGWHFPELAKITKDNYIYARMAQFIGDRGTLDETKLDGMTDITGEEDEVRGLASI